LWKVFLSLRDNCIETQMELRKKRNKQIVDFLGQPGLTTDTPTTDTPASSDYWHTDYWYTSQLWLLTHRLLTHQPALTTDTPVLLIHRPALTTDTPASSDYWHTDYWHTRPALTTDTPTTDNTSQLWLLTHRLLTTPGQLWLLTHQPSSDYLTDIRASSDYLTAADYLTHPASSDYLIPQPALELTWDHLL